VLDIPDLPLVLSLLERFRLDEDLLDLPEGLVESYCIERGLNSLHVRAYLRRVGRLIESVFSQIPDLRFVGLSVWTSNYLTTLLAAAYLKRRANPPFIVAGGPQVSQSAASAQLALRAGVFDAVAVGEGEQTLTDLYSQYSRDRGAVAGPVAGTITYDPGSRGFLTARRSLLSLKELPLPDFDEMHLPAYEIDGQRVVSYQLSRGCTDKCSFCSEWVFWRHFRMTGMEKAVADVRELQRRWGAARIWFTDSLLNGHMNNLREFAEGLLRKGIQIDWSGYMRAQVDLPTGKLLRRAGCTWVFIGVESLADETLQLMNKRMTENQNLAAVQAFLDAGIRVKVGLIPGFPGDTRERFIRTAKVLRKMQADSTRLAVSHEAFVVLPGQPIYDNLGKYGLLPIPWSDATLEIAPDLADIARQVWCRVEGANQGLERWGEYMVSLSLTGPAQPMDDYLSESREPITPFELTMSPLGPGVWLARTLSPQGHFVGAILTEQEHSWFVANGRTTEARPTPLCENPVLGPKLLAILGDHAAAVSPDDPLVRPMKYRRMALPFLTPSRVALGPLTIARRLTGTLWLANLTTGRSAAVSATDETAAAILAGCEPALVDGAIALAELGLLVYTDLPEDAGDPLTEQKFAAAGASTGIFVQVG
jgi:radical SAM superfamily enzyme YgiQ (UPF0313 family)